MQNAWNKYGEKRFVFFIIEECAYDTFVLLDCEEKYFRLNEGNTYNKPKYVHIRSYKNKAPKEPKTPKEPKEPKEPKAPGIPKIPKASKPKKELLSKEELRRRRAEYARKRRASKPPKEKKSRKILSDEERKQRAKESQKKWHEENKEYLNAYNRLRYREKGQIRHGKFYGGPIDKDSKG